jgi:uncharacterized protein (DUF697 family)/predicted GTPase
MMAREGEVTSSTLDKRLAELSRATPAPILWMIGKTQSGKTSIIRYLTGAEDAEIGRGFAPCTRFSRQYAFPSSEMPLLQFLDTRGLEEPGYDPAEDIAAFNENAHVVVLTIKLLDHALSKMIPQLKRIRQSKPKRPVILVLSCLHEAYPQKQHPQPYPYDVAGGAVPESVQRSIDRHRTELSGLYDYLVPIDLTPADEGFTEPNYGGPQLVNALVDALPEGYRQTLLTLEKVTHSLQEHYARKAMPYIMGYSSLAATAGAFPIPWVDLLALPGIQTQMIHHLARLYGQPLDGKRFIELAGTLGLGMVMRQAIREFVKFIPFLGSAMSAVLAGSSTFALGKAFCYYYSAVLEGHVPEAHELKKYYHDQLSQAETFWKKRS